MFYSRGLRLIREKKSQINSSQSLEILRASLCSSDVLFSQGSLDLTCMSENQANSSPCEPPINHNVHSICHSTYDSAKHCWLCPSYRHTESLWAGAQKYKKETLNHQSKRGLAKTEGVAWFCKSLLPTLSDKKLRFLPVLEKAPHMFCLDFKSLGRPWWLR